MRARIGSIPYEIDRSVEDVLFSQEGDEIGLQVSRGPIDQRVGDCITCWWRVEPSYAPGFAENSFLTKASPRVDDRDKAHHCSPTSGMIFPISIA
jgi:hypothetical protein